MNAIRRNPWWLAHAGGGFIVLFLYLLTTLIFGMTFPSYRIADPVKMGPGLRISENGDVYPGKRVVFGWPLPCIAWREEGEGPIGTPQASQMRIVATRISFLALALNLVFVIAG
jgi:hypothetical protein